MGHPQRPMIQDQRGCDMKGKLSTGKALFPTLGDEVYDGGKQEGLVRRAMVGYLRVLDSPPVRPQICKDLEVFVKHLPGPAPQALLFLILKTRSDRESDKMMYVPCSQFKMWVTPSPGYFQDRLPSSVSL